jgi:hypothetical protein
MDFKIEIDQKQVEDHLVKSIIDSSIGKHIETEINNLLKINSIAAQPIVKTAIQKVMIEEICKIVVNLIQSKEEDIRKIISEQLTNDFIYNFIVTSLNTFKQKF